jgi:ribosome biogenesis GTPase / thiamine phosphate phosphatase
MKNMEKTINIEDLGYSAFFQSNRDRLGWAGFSVARVVAEYKEAYKVINANGEFFAKITGKQMFDASSREDFPAVGDWVAIAELGNDQAAIHGVLPRLTAIKRRYGDKNNAGEKTDIQIIAANIDVALVVESVDRDFNLNRFERYFALARSGNVIPAVVLNKIDLLSADELREKTARLENRLSGFDIVPTSTVSGEGLEDLKKYMAKGKTYCFLGSSGVGKSSLINKLLGENAIKTGEISSYSGRGKHVTTGRQMYFLENGGIVIDNPGVREVGMADAAEGIDAVFEDITAVPRGCKFANCTHTHEPGCEVRNAVEAGQLDREKYANYINLKKEAAYEEMSDLEKREKDRNFGKYVKRVKDDLKKIGRKNF